MFKDLDQLIKQIKKPTFHATTITGHRNVVPQHPLAEQYRESKKRRCSECKQALTPTETFANHNKTQFHLEYIFSDKYRGSFRKACEEIESNYWIPARCDICNLSFFSASPYKVHEESNAHQERLRQFEAVRDRISGKALFDGVTPQRPETLSGYKTHQALRDCEPKGCNKRS